MSTDQKLENALMLIVRMRQRLGAIIAAEPVVLDGTCYYEHYDGDGNYTGSQMVDPVWLVQQMATEARDALMDIELSQREYPQ